MREVKDHFYHKAKKENYPARSIYKLEEIDRKYNIIKKGHKVLDLGAAPGSWSKYCGAAVGASGMVVAVDKEELKIELPVNIKFIREDVYKIDLESITEKFDVVLSDMAPNTTGTREVDQARSMELVRQAYKIAKATLKKNGHFICKAFQGPDLKNLLDDIRPQFEWLKIAKPQGSRQESFEVFIVGYKFK